jgi:hypothetical protein
LLRLFLVYPLKNQSIEGHGDEEANCWPSAR